MKKILFLLFLLPLFLNASDKPVIGCAPVKRAVVQYYATISSVKDGNWSDPSVWGGRIPSAGDVVIVSKDVTLDIDATVAGLTIMPSATLRDHPTKDLILRTSENIINKGLSYRHGTGNSLYQVIGADESKMIGQNMDPRPEDKGFWTVENGQRDWQGIKKNPYSWLVADAKKGQSFITVIDASGWKVGDEIFISPTRTPDVEGGLDWYNGKPVDKFALEFERRLISSVTGNNIQFLSPLQYDHLKQNFSDTSFTAEVGNLTRNIRIEGTVNGRTHVFTRSTKPSIIKYVGYRYTGPRKWQGWEKSGERRNAFISGLYGDHVHHSGYGSAGTEYEGNAMYDGGSKGFVPHVSHKISYKKDIVFNHMEMGHWWDFQDMSHYITYDGELVALQVYNGVEKASGGMMLGAGDGNVAKNNIMVYANWGDIHDNAAYNWDANNEGIWDFVNNLTHSSRGGLRVWQSTVRNHTEIRTISYNETIGLFHGSYANAYNYRDCKFYSPSQVKAASGNTSGVRFENCLFEVKNHPWAVQIWPGPVKSGSITPNYFINSTFKGYTDYAVQMYTIALSGEDPYKEVVLINSKYTGKLTGYSPLSTAGSIFRINPPELPNLFGTGTGLTSRYYNDLNFSSLAFERIDPVIMFTEWRGDREFYKMPFYGVHHLLTSERFTIRATGKYQAQYSGPHTFYMLGSGGNRVWMDNKLILDRWADNGDEKALVASSTINLTAGQKYPIKLEYMNEGGAAGWSLLFKAGNLSSPLIVPESQLYSDQTPTPINQPPVVNAGEDVSLTYPDTTAKLDGYITDDQPGYFGKWVQISGPSKAVIEPLSDAAKAKITGLSAGSYVFTLTGTDAGGLTASDQVTVTVKPKPVITYYSKATSGIFTRNNCKAGEKGSSITYTVRDSALTSLVSQSTADALAIKRVADSGQVYANINGTCSVIAPVDPCTVFDEVFYLKTYPLVKAAVDKGQFTSGLDHYNKYGKREGRKINPDCNPVVELGRAKVGDFTLIVFSDGTYKVEKL